jgi:hypothetical protein
MKNLLKLSGPVFVLALAASAYAEPSRDDGWRNPPPHSYEPAPKCDNVAPEVDPSLAIGGLTLLGGTLTVIRSRRRK